MGGNQYRAIIFMSTTRDTMWKHGSALLTTNTNLTNNTHLDAAKTALRQYMRAGGGFFGIHNVFGTEYNWPYYEGLVGNANYYDHGADQQGNVSTWPGATDDPSMEGMPANWTTVDEFYNMQPYPTNVKYLIKLDENSLAQRHGTHPGPRYRFAAGVVPELRRRPCHGDLDWPWHQLLPRRRHDGRWRAGSRYSHTRPGGIQEVRRSRHQERDGGYRYPRWWYRTEHTFL
jgi:hypothetical protein